MSQAPVYVRGLEDVIADESKICTIDGIKGELYYRGYPIQVLAEKACYTEIAYLLIYEKLPNQAELKAFEADLIKHRNISDFVLKAIQAFPKEAHPMNALQASVAMLGMQDDCKASDKADKNKHRSMKLIAMFPTLVAAFARHREGKTFLAPRSDLSHSANFLYMLTGNVPTPQVEKMFDVCLVLHAEHTFNASTFTGRVVASTLADIYTSVSAAVGALYGPLHGGANEAVLEMVNEIGSVDNVKAWFEKADSSKRKIMGMGHRVYKTIDPRAKILRKLLLELAEQHKDLTGLKILDALAALMAEKMQKTGKNIWPNVDYFSGNLYSMMGIDKIYFTPIFAVSRIAGWASHILELWTDNRLYRPEAHYTGPNEVEFVALEKRS